MRLNQLEIFGFKSFAQKIVIPFEPGITAIVGPNGCGKSNVVEAIRWVLGEQRAGSFRSQRMEDVIFAGTRQRKALGMAEVALAIENRDSALPVEFAEVVLTRRLFRSGESDYLLNKIPCRLLDITNLLMDTGLGQGAYAVMEQGMVDEIISDKTENRRRILEEAAGITKYKVRRRSTRNRLEATQADLQRIEDIITEVKRQVDYLGRQVGRARRYRELKEELDQLDVRLGRQRFFALSAQISPLQDAFAALSKAAEEGYTRFTSREAELEKARLVLTEAEKAMQEAGLELNRRIEAIHEREQLLVAVRERREAAEQIRERTARERTDYSSQLEAVQQQRRDNTAHLDEARTTFVQIERDLQAHQQHAAQAEEEYDSYRAELDQRQRGRMEHLRQGGEISRALERQQAERDALDERAVAMRSEEDAATAEREQALQAAGEAEAALAATQQQLSTCQQQRTATLAAREQTEKNLRDLGEQRDAAQRAAEANQARLQVLEKVRAGYEGYQSGVRTLMLESPHAALFRGVLGRSSRSQIRSTRGRGRPRRVAASIDRPLGQRPAQRHCPSPRAFRARRHPLARGSPAHPRFGSDPRPHARAARPALGLRATRSLHRPPNRQPLAQHLSGRRPANRIGLDAPLPRCLRALRHARRRCRRSLWPRVGWPEPSRGFRRPRPRAGNPHPTLAHRPPKRPLRGPWPPARRARKATRRAHATPRKSSRRKRKLAHQGARAGPPAAASPC